MNYQLIFFGQSVHKVTFSYTVPVFVSSCYTAASSVVAGVQNYFMCCCMK